MGNYLFNDFVKTQGQGPDWKIQFDKPSRKIKNYFEEAKLGMQLLNEKRNGKFKLFLSGGVDSLYIANMLIYMDYDFDPVIINNQNHKGDSYSMHDIKYALEFCQTWGLDPEIINFNFDEFVESGEILEIANDAECCVVSYQVPLKLMKSMDGFILFGSSPPILKHIDDEWYFADYEFAYTVDNYFEKHRLQGCSAVLYYTPEMFVSFLAHPVMQKLTENKTSSKHSNVSSKSFVLNDNDFVKVDEYDFQKGDRVKFTGYEKIYDVPLGQHKNILEFENLKQKWNGTYMCEYQQFMKQFREFI